MVSSRAFRWYHRLSATILLVSQQSQHAVNCFSFSGDNNIGTSSAITFNTPRKRTTRCRRIAIFATTTSVVPNDDSEEELASIQSWRSTSATAASAQIVYSAPSFLDCNATVQVKERAEGWHTLGIIGGPTKSIYHGVFQKNGTTGLVDPYALGPSEYIRTMASAALCLAASTSATATTTSTNAVRNEQLQQTQQQQKQQQQQQPPPLRFLHMGYGSGSLMRLLRHIIPNSQHVAMELDPTVVEAAAELGLFDPTASSSDSKNDERVLVGDALTYQLSSSSSCNNSYSYSSKSNSNSNSNNDHDQEQRRRRRRFDGICIDVFDGQNLMPSEFYSVQFLKRMYEDILVSSDDDDDDDDDGRRIAFMVHNFHVGNEKLALQLEDAMSAYRNVFGGEKDVVDGVNKGSYCRRSSGTSSCTLYKVDSLNTNNHGGNVILIAIKKNDNDNGNGNAAAAAVESTTGVVEDAAILMELASQANGRWGKNIRFDVASRIKDARQF